MLNTKQIDGLKATGRAYKVADDDGLYLFVTPTGGKSWRYNHTENGKQQTKTYGRYPVVGLAEARRLHHAFKHSTQEAGDTFKAVADKWMRLHLPGLKNVKHQKQVGDTLAQFVFPAIGQTPIKDVTRKALVAVVQAVDARGTTETAHRVAGRIKQVFDHAIDLGELESNPAIGLTRVLKPRKVEHMKALPPGEVPALMAAIETYPEDVTRIGLQLLAHTFVRTRELTQAKWAEFDLKNRVWIVPGERMKMGMPHVVPLSDKVLSLLEQLKTSEFVLESPIRHGHPISENTLLFALYRLGYRGRMTGHGFRAVASTVLNESGLWTKDAIERQLAHKEGDAVRAAYHRAEYFDERVRMMGWWSSWLSPAP